LFLGNSSVMFSTCKGQLRIHCPPTTGGFSPPDCPWIAMSGTSKASPYVADVAAQNARARLNPTLSYQVATPG
jgi:hypothetical protein